MARLDRVFIDTSELFPYTIMDVLLTFAERLMFAWRWSEDLLDEWERVIVREGQRTPESASALAQAIRTHFASERIDPSLYRDKITDDLSTDADDRIHVAAAIYGGATVALTRNLRHWQSAAMRDAGVEVMTADDYLCRLMMRNPESAKESFVATAEARRRPPVTPSELADRIEAAKAEKFAALIRLRLGVS
jgi:hypothetical protein